MHRTDANALALPVPDYDDPKDLYAFYGLAVYYAQLLDHRLRYLAVVLRLAGRGPMTQEASDHRGVWLDRLMVGQLLNATRHVVAIQERLEEWLGKARDKREYLAHHFFQIHVEASWSAAGRRAMLDELRDIITLFKRAETHVEQVHRHLQSACSIQQVGIEKALEVSFQ